MKKMKRRVLLTMLSLMAVMTYGQPETDGEFFHHKKCNTVCDTKAEQADSTINYAYDAFNDQYSPDALLIYKYDRNGNLTETFSKTLPDRQNVYHQIFYYDNDNNQVRYVYQIWVNGQWTDNLITDKTFSADGLLLTEVFLREDATGTFAPYQRHFYQNENGRPVSYLRQIKNAAGEWYDFSDHIFVYDDLGRLTVLYGKYHNSDLVYWERTYVYNEEGKIGERYLRQLKYDPVQRKNVLTNITYSKYDYNIFGDAQEIFNYSWLDNNWVYTSKDIGYFSLLKGKKVLICHKGKDLCVAAEAVEAHLNHGDHIGSCSPDEERENPSHDSCGPNSRKDIKLDIAPNPARQNIRVTMPSDFSGFENCIILSQQGRVLKNIRVTGQCEVEIDISDLRPGVYFIKAVGPGIESSKILIKE